jgi:hypothetical protein
MTPLEKKMAELTEQHARAGLSGRELVETVAGAVEQPTKIVRRFIQNRYPGLMNSVRSSAPRPDYDRPDHPVDDGEVDTPPTDAFGDGGSHIEGGHRF